MQLADFIEREKERILVESVEYARSLMRLQGQEEQVLRDHLPKVLEAISADLRTAQSRTQSIAKSHGLAPEGGSATAAATHGLLRARSGLHIEQVVAEYRALRSCVLRRWSEDCAPGPEAVQDMIRFGEAIDQALAESVRFHAAEVERWQQIFLGVLGHDLRAPLNAIALTTELIARNIPVGLGPTVATLKRSTRRMASLLDSLLEYNRAGLGSGMPIERAPLELARACRQEIELQRTALADCRIELVVQGDTRGEFDASRVREALGNLIANGVKHGLQDEPVIVTLDSDDQFVRLSVENAMSGPVIPAHEMEQWFEPLHRGVVPRGAASDRAHLGLGLFIARQIARAHGGEVHGHCAAQSVRFTLILPRYAPAAPLKAADSAR